jgi:RHS repeat-associated protein
MKKHLIFIISFLVGLTVKSYGQNIQQTGPIILPVAPSTSYIVSPGQNRSIISATSIILGDGTHFQEGSLVVAKINNSPIVTPAPSNPSQDLSMNWTFTRTYDLDGNIVGENKDFFNNAGHPIQSQVKNIADGHVLANQVIYDNNGRAALSTLAAPINNAEFGFKNNFVTNNAGTNYSAQNFDLGKTNNPDPVNNSIIGTLGWYYSDNNTVEPYVATTAFPYSRTSFFNDGTGAPKNSADVGDELRMGKGREVASFNIPVLNELDYYSQIRDRFFPVATVGNNGSLKANALQTVAMDQNGNQSLQITDLSGKPLMSGRPDPNGILSISNNVTINAVAQEYVYGIAMAGLIMGGENPNQGGIGGGPISFSINSKYNVTVFKNGVQEYSGIGNDFQFGSVSLNGPTYVVRSANPFSITHSDGCNDCPAKVAESELSSIHYFNLLQPSTVTITGNYELYDMKTETQVSAGYLPKGYYKLRALNGDVTISYTNNLSDVSYVFYNQLGQPVATIAPEGVKALITNGLTSYANLGNVPFVNTNEYDLEGRLIAASRTDGGRTEFIYRKDGSMRFSQNAEQRKTGKFSYSNYDRWGRIFESGEYLPGDINFSMAKTNIVLLEDISSTGGLTGGTRQFQKISHYDLPNQSHGLSSYVQDAAFLKTSVSWTENTNSKTWYNYDEQGRVIWIVKYLNGLGYKTIDYTYNSRGMPEHIDFQKAVPNERFVQHYEYDSNSKLTTSYTSKDGINKTLQAKYYYYLHGPLKRTELAGDLQGIDYTYTLQGLLKTINHPKNEIDPGKDGLQNNFAPDAFAMALEYYTGDYVRNSTGISSLNGNTNKTWYNGNITAQSWRSLKPNSIVGVYGQGVNNPAMFTYEYDDKEQFNNNKFGTPDFNTNNFLESSNVNREHGVTYDANGNVKSLNRNNSFANSLSLNYNYLINTNKLATVTNYANYSYDDIGQLISRQKVNGQEIYLTYETNGKISAIYSDAALTQLKVSFSYDELGLRIRKTDHSQNINYFYLYDVGRKLIAVYDDNGTPLQQKELAIYSGERIGSYNRINNVYQYELVDNLGNVRVVINGNKTNNGSADVAYYSDYYPFGSQLTLSNNDYRFGYQGKFAEFDKETGWNSFELRMYDSIIGRWLNVDPINQYFSPYLAMGNNPVRFVDPDGGEDGDPKPSFFKRLWLKVSKFDYGWHGQGTNDKPIMLNTVEVSSRITEMKSEGNDPKAYVETALDVAANLSQDYRDKLFKIRVSAPLAARIDGQAGSILKMSNYGKMAKNLGRASNLLAAYSAYEDVKDYKSGQISATRLTFRLSTSTAGIVAASRFGGWYGAAVGALAVGGEITYDFGAWFGTNFSNGMYQIESAMNKGWVPGRY